MTALFGFAPLRSARAPAANNEDPSSLKSVIAWVTSTTK
jgi:hypothetical protein